VRTAVPHCIATNPQCSAPTEAPENVCKADQRSFL